jgi:hypothetical protein
MFVTDYLEARYVDGKKAPHKMSTFLHLRKQPFFYKVFLRTFVKPVVGIATFNERVRNPKFNPNLLCSPSDEAFALLVVENNYNRWVDIFQSNDYSIPHSKRNRDGNTKTCTSNIRPLYTEGGNVYSENESYGSKSKGWSIAGIHRFNKLVQLILEDRMNHPNFLKEFCESERKKLEANVPKKSKKVKVVPLAHQDSLFDDEDINLDLHSRYSQSEVPQGHLSHQSEDEQQVNDPVEDDDHPSQANEEEEESVDEPESDDSDDENQPPEVIGV